MATQPIVLLVDDEPSMLKALRRALRREPLALETADSAASALTRIARTPPVDLVISDHKMPGMTGIDMLARIRATSPGTARILLSGWTEQIPPSEVSAAGLSAMLSKPWEDAELKAAIRSALATRPVS